MWNSLFGSSQPEPQAHEVTFTLNGKTVTVGSEVSDGTSLNAYIRDVAHLKGTKFMCYEGGCGACIVAANAEHPVTKQRSTFSVNSCLVPVLACHGWRITTTEGLGDKRSGYHPVQANLAQFNGTQCGFCSPGMVMNMYSLMADKTPTMAEVENSFGGNLCRCTGYRPILDAFKALASDATPSMKKTCADIEDLYKICSKTGRACSGSCKKNAGDFEDVEAAPPSSVHVALLSTNWYKVTSVAQLFSVLDSLGDVGYKLVAGNTGDGVYRMGGVVAYIDIKDVVELRTNTTSPTFTVGANVTLSEVINLFNGTNTAGFTYLKKLAQHLDQVANVPVRNIGTIAGNLFLKKQHPEFPSDIYTMLETVGATLNIMTTASITNNVTLSNFLSMDMTKKVIRNIVFPSLDATYHLRTFKIAPRAQNAHAYVNAGFLVKVENTTTWRVTQQPRIVFGGINPSFTRATSTETYLNGKGLLDAATITGAMTSLGTELVPDWTLPDAAPTYRKPLAQALFYKFLLGLDPTRVTPNKRTGAQDLVRPLSSGLQDFDTNTSVWPLNQPIPKLEAVAQTAGEAEYVNDIPTLPDELHACFVLTKVATGNVSRIDPSAALAMPGVVAFYSAPDIPGSNNFTPSNLFLFVEQEEIFCSGPVRYAGQVVGMVVAESHSLAMSGARVVVVEYTNVDKPMVSLNDVLSTTGGRTKRAEKKHDKPKIKDDKAVVHNITGRFEIGKQYHLHMETQTCRVVPTEDGYDVFSANQWMDHVQQVVASTINVPENTVNVSVRRLGGGYGGKISRPAHLAGACAVAAHKLGRPVRMVMTLSSNMEVMGKRYAYRNDYQVGVDAAGKIETLTADVASDSGFTFNEAPGEEVLTFFPNCYDSTKFNMAVNLIRTDTASNISCRGPGTTEGVAFIEEIMEHIARVAGLDPLAVRLANMTTQDNPLPGMIIDLKAKADYDNRQALVTAFNNANRWKKRGMALVPMQYRFNVWGNFSSLVSIFHGDGTVAITHGGIEMGQGINTKVAQVAAHILGIPLSSVSIKPATSLTSPNGMVTGGSIGSEAVSFATMMSCQELLRRLEPVRAGMVNPTWPQLVHEAYLQNIELCATHMYTDKDPVEPYNIWGVAAAEAEVDVLTGEKQILRVDILEDVGESLSPLVDVGQIEGAFVMGMGYWLSEELIHDPATGRLLNNNTWNYKPPGAKDIPADFRVHFRKGAPNPVGVLRSKATGEPALNMSIVTLFAVRNALDSARKDVGSVDYYQMKLPATPESVYLASLTDPNQFQL